MRGHVVEVRAGVVLGENRKQGIAAQDPRRRKCGLAPHIGRLVPIIVAGDLPTDIGVCANQPFRDLGEIAGIERYHDRPVSCLVQRGAGGKALADQDWRAGFGDWRTYNKHGTCHRQISLEQFVAARIDRLQRGKSAVDIEERHQHMLTIKPRAVRADAFGDEIGMSGVVGLRRCPTQAHLLSGHFAPFGLFCLKTGLTFLELCHARLGQHGEHSAGQAFSGGTNIEPGLAVEKIENVAVGIAAKAMEARFLGIDGEGWRAFHMERAQAHQRRAARLQR